MNRRIDIHEYEKRYHNALANIKAADISEKNKQTILRFEKACTLETLSLSRRIRILGTLIMLSKKLGKEFDKATKDDLRELVLKIESNKEWEVSTKHTNKAILKKFYKWLMFGDEYQSMHGYPEIISWLKVSIKAKDEHKVQAADILTEKEIEKLIEATEYPRDKAFISMLYELGARIGEIGTLRIGDISKDKYSFVLDLSGKTGHRTPRIVASDPYLSAWLNVHPLKDNPAAPLWVMVGDRNKNRPMKYGAFRALVLRLKEKARIKKRLYHHLFRHTRVTHLLANKQINEAQAKVYFGWLPSSTMLSEYSHLVSQDVNNVMLEIHGIKTSEQEKHEPKVKQCPRCRELNPKDHLFCKKCGGVLEVKTALELDEKRSGFDDILASLFEEPSVQTALASALVKKGLGRKLMELGTRT